MIRDALNKSCTSERAALERDGDEEETSSDVPTPVSTSERAAAFSSAAVTGLGSYVTSGSLVVMWMAGVLTLAVLAVVVIVAGR